MYLNNVIKEVSKFTDLGVTFVGQGEKIFLSYKDIYDYSMKLGSWMNDKGIIKGDFILTQIDNNVQFIILFWSCLIYGYILVPYENISIQNEREVENLIKTYRGFQNIRIFTDGDKIKEFLNNVKMETIEIIKIPTIIELKSYDETNNKHKSISHEGKEIALVMHTSGSTQSPKGVMISRENIHKNMNQILNKLYISQKDIFVNWMSLTHVAGLMLAHILPIFTKSNQVLTTPKYFIGSTCEYLRLLSDINASVTILPNFALEFLLNFSEEQSISDISLSKLRYLINGSELINYNNNLEFYRKYSKYGYREEAMTVVYGMTETTSAVSIHSYDCLDRYYRCDREVYLNEHTISPYSPSNIKKDNFFNIAFVGEPLIENEIKILNCGHEVKEGMIGNVYIKGPSVAKSYISEGKILPLVNDDGFFNTGDMGTIIKNKLIITGREKDIIFFNGLKIYAGEIESICKNITLLEKCEFVACGIINLETLKDELVIFVQKSEIDMKEEEIKKLIKREVGKAINQSVSYIIFVDKIDKNKIGKKQRNIMKKRFEKGEFSL
ncbi:AMP-binding protein [Anaerococcus murdochii]|uniref:AMP-binding enzyme n=3 Tax=Peptoniphilaceae TaxID=1570339 RepID=E0NK99_9FIRM|nr:MULTISPECIES: AMP-binding protein [Peptoniphilaceae]HBL5939693.1 AMP-binding protein [Clostridioides difficile]EFM25799.1 AMP-binding enzyme [Peptoniphilus duerdenii ATCC BAA-1640]KGF03000.1 hypothetical protein HMPREF1630_08350 [Anaerococcus lactolyticus S7-1-13]MDK8282760.1 AMP-binding protein [Peptoniphilus lacrimalis]MDU5087076.1 AMP-binding protein [Anaerococcus vaginalis]